MAKKGSRKARNSFTRMIAVDCLYQFFITGQDFSVIRSEDLDVIGDQLSSEGDDFVSIETEFLSAILRSVKDRFDDLEEMIDQAANIDRDEDNHPKKLREDSPLLYSVLICGASELVDHTDTDAPIIISDYIGVAQSYFDHGEPKLVNAILDRVNKAVRI